MGCRKRGISTPRDNSLSTRTCLPHKTVIRLFINSWHRKCMVLVLVSANQPNKTKPIAKRNIRTRMLQSRKFVFYYTCILLNLMIQSGEIPMTQPKARHPLFLVLKILLLHSVRLPSVPLDSHLILGRLRLHILGTVGLLLRSSTVDSLAFPCAFT